MPILLDTDALLAWIAHPETLPQKAQDQIADPSQAIYYSAASLWRLSLLQRHGRADAPPDLSRHLASADLKELPITGRHAERARDLDEGSSDPFQQLILAQALEEGFTLLTASR